MGWLEFDDFSGVTQIPGQLISSNVIYSSQNNNKTVYDYEYSDIHTAAVTKVNEKLCEVLRNDAVFNFLDMSTLYEDVKFLSLNNCIDEVYQHLLRCLSEFFDQDENLNNTIDEIRSSIGITDPDTIVVKLWQILNYTFKKMNIIRQIMLYYEKCYLESSYSKLTVFESFHVLLYKKLFPDEHATAFILANVYNELKKSRKQLTENYSLILLLAYIRLLSIIVTNTKSVKRVDLSTLKITFNFNATYLQNLNEYIEGFGVQNPEKIVDIINFETGLSTTVFGNPKNENLLNQLNRSVIQNFEIYISYANSMKLPIIDKSIFDTKVLNSINTIIMRIIFFRLVISNSSKLNTIIQLLIVESNFKSLKILYKLFILYRDSNALTVKQAYLRCMDNEVDVDLVLSQTNIVEAILLKEFSIAVQNNFFQISQDSNKKIKKTKKLKGNNTKDGEGFNDVPLRIQKKYEILIDSGCLLFLKLKDLITKCFDNQATFANQLDNEFDHFISFNNFEVIIELVKYVDFTLNEVFAYVTEDNYSISSGSFFENCVTYDLHKFTSRISTICIYFSRMLNHKMFGFFSTQYKLYLSKRLLNRNILLSHDILWCRIFFEMVMLSNFLHPIVDTASHLFPQNLWSYYAKLTSMPDSVLKLFPNNQKYSFTKEFNKYDLINGISVFYKMISDMESSVYKMGKVINKHSDTSVFLPIVLEAKQWPNFSFRKPTDSNTNSDMELGVGLIRKFRKFNNDFSKGFYGNINDEHKVLNWEFSLSYLFLDFNLNDDTVISIHTVFIIGKILLLFNDEEKLTYSSIIRLINKAVSDDTENLIKRSLYSLQTSNLFLQTDMHGLDVPLGIFKNDNIFRINENYSNKDEYLDIPLISNKLFAKSLNR